LYLCHAHTRHRFGKDDFGLNFRTIPSRFLREIPEEFLQRSTVKSYPDFKRRRRLALEKEFGDLGPTGQMPDEKSLFKIGQYVNHEVFGRGQVLGVDQSTLGTKLTIQFDNLEIKKVIAEYANLTIADNLE
jgi:DNA helicase-2/ATP-dependent DNA helicase PcrA